jgi:hypothetical protein
MTSTNLWKRLKSLIPEAPLLIGVVDSVSAYGAVVLLPDGSPVSVRGAAVVGQNVFIRSGVIEGVAPSLTTVLIEI